MKAKVTEGDRGMLRGVLTVVLAVVLLVAMFKWASPFLWWLIGGDVRYD